MAGSSKAPDVYTLHSVARNDGHAAFVARFGERYLAYRSAWRGAGEQCRPTPFPLQLDVDLADACNLRCATCHQAYRERTGEVLEPELLEKALEEGAREGLCSVNFGASGEPLLRRELLLEGIRRARGGGAMEVYLHTNGVLLDARASASVIEAGLTHLCVSLDAAAPETYRAVRRSAALPRVRDNVLRFLELRGAAELPLVRVSFVRHSANIDEAEAFAEEWSGSVDKIDFQDYVAFPGSAPIDSARFERVPLTNCAGVWNRTMLWPGGDVTLCCAHRGPDAVLGNLREKSLKEIWGGERARDLRSAFGRGEGIPAFCRACLESCYRPRVTAAAQP